MKESEIIKINCSVCNKEIDLTNIKDKVYQVSSAINLLNKDVFDVIDCPNCNCQIYLKKRLPIYAKLREVKED